jgi:exonuclease III
MRSGRGVLRRPRPQLKRIEERNVKIGSWNVGSMTGRGRELVEVCKRRNIGILCVQETKWTGKSARELGEGIKIHYSGEQSSRNGMGVIQSPEFKEKVIEVSIPRRLIKRKLVIAGEIFNIVSAYAPQSGKTDKGGVFERLGRCDVESAENREDCSRS